MKIFLFIIFLFFSLNAEDTAEKQVDSNSTAIETEKEEAGINEIIVVKDNSGLSDDELRSKAKESDRDKKKVSIEKVVEATDITGQVDISKIQKTWEDLSPSPVKYDWVQTKSGEWFKGEIKALYDDRLEFDSDEVGLYTFKFEDVVCIKSYNIISVNIENLASFPGIIRLKNDDITIIQGDNSYEFKKKDIISFAPDGEHERNLWSGKITASSDLRRGNTNQYDASIKVNVLRRSASSRLTLDYLGRISSKDEVETINDHRINQKYDRYITRRFFWTPVFSEFYKDEYKNIDKQITLGLGVGYTIVDTVKTTWSVSGGPAGLSTEYITVANNEDSKYYAPALELSTKYKLELKRLLSLTKKLEMTYDYKLTYTNDVSGRYRHHMLLTFENEITSWLDLDITGVWDYILKPERESSGNIPFNDDFQLLIGLGVEF